VGAGESPASFGGLAEGVQVINAKDLGSDYIQRVFLLSDGLANVGVYDYPGLTKMAKDLCGGKAPASLSTFGCGNDHVQAQFYKGAKIIVNPLTKHYFSCKFFQ